MTGLQNGQSLGLTGFGASAHLVLKMLKHRFPDCGIYVFARSAKEREFALEDANIALLELKERKIRGAKVLMID